MQVEFLDKFLKDLDKIRSKSLSENVSKIILKAEKANSLSDISNIKKLSGFKSAYRIKTGDYRIGIFVEGNLI